MVLRQKEPLLAGDIHHLNPHTALSTMTLSPPLFLIHLDVYKRQSESTYGAIHNDVVSSPFPVSYTHLDVYKRQALNT